MVPRRVAEVSMGPQRVSMDPQLVPGDSLLFTMGPAWVPLLVSIRAQGSFSVHLTCPLEPLVQGDLDVGACCFPVNLLLRGVERNFME